MSDDENSSETDIPSSKGVASEDSYENIASVMKTPWDPLYCADWDIQRPSATCLARIKRDICSAFKDPPPGMFISPDPDNITKIHAIVIGPFDTPYESGFFYFVIRCPPDYPIRAPRCRLMTTGNSTVRFNPNLYRNGKVCLSILGTWSGPSWTPVQGISSLLLSIQSLMSENPYHNEPGYEQERTPGASKDYNEIIKHETLRVAVCGMLENQNSCPEQLHEIITKQFLNFYDYYIQVCTENADKDGTPMMDPFGEQRGKFEYSLISTRLQKLKSKLSNNDSSNESKPIDARTREIMHDAALLDTNQAFNDGVDLDDIFYDDEEEEEEEDDEQLEENLCT